MEWTQREIDKTLAMRAEGITYKEIGKRLGRSSAGVKVKVYRYRRPITLKKNYDAEKIEAQRLRDEGIPVKAIALSIGMSEAWVCKWTQAPPHKVEKWMRWSKEERDVIVQKANRFRDKGLSCEEIGKAFGFSDTWASKWTDRSKWRKDPGIKYAIHALCKAHAVTGDINAAVKAIRKTDIIGRYIDEIKDKEGECHDYRINALRADRTQRRL